MEPLVQPAHNGGDACANEQPFKGQLHSAAAHLLTLGQRHLLTTARSGLRSEWWKGVERGKALYFLQAWRIDDQTFQTMNLLSEFLGAAPEMTRIHLIGRLCFTKFMR